MTLDEAMRKTLRTGRNLYSSFVGGSLIYLIMLMWLRWKGFSVFLPNDPNLTLISAVLGFLGAMSLVGGIYCPRWFKTSHPRGLAPAFTASMLRWTLFQVIAIYGLILGILSAGWEITIPFFITSITALILTFPTEGRWKRMMGR